MASELRIGVAYRQQPAVQAAKSPAAQATVAAPPDLADALRSARAPQATRTERIAAFIKAGQSDIR
jgi:hypothetical protein